jgi:hypothetical protein
VGGSGTILRNMDGGSTWSSQNNPLSGTTMVVAGLQPSPPRLWLFQNGHRKRAGSAVE